MILKKFRCKIISIIVICTLLFSTLASTGIIGHKNLFAEEIKAEVIEENNATDQDVVEDGNGALEDETLAVEASDEASKVDDNVNVVAPMKTVAEEKVLYAMSTEDKLTTRALGDTIAATFPDPKLALKVAEILGKDVNDLLTTSDLAINTLIVSNSEIKDLTGVELFTNLGSLDVSRNQITQIPDGITNLVNLQTLYVDYNQLTKLPDNLGNLSKLHSFNISWNQIEALPDSIGGLVELQVFNSDHNAISYIPDSIGNLEQLVFFYLDSNQLTSIPSTVGNLNDVRHLFLQNNQLTQLPDSLGDMASLYALNVSRNELIAMPENITNATALIYLYMEDNLLTKLPDNIANLTNLTSLTFSNNGIEFLPEGIETLTGIDYVSGAVNRLHDLPQGQADWICMPRTTTQFHVQTYEQSVGQAFINQDFIFTPIPIVSQAPTFIEPCDITYQLVKPNGETVIVTPVLQNGKLTLSADHLSDVGDYQLMARVIGAYLTGSIYTMTFNAEIYQEPVEPGITPPVDPADRENPKKPGLVDNGKTDSKNKTVTGTVGLKKLPKTGNESIVYLGGALLLIGIALLGRRIYLNQRDS